MALATVFEKLEDAPEAIREHLAERDGKFYLQVDKPENVASGLAKNRDEILAEKKKLDARLAEITGRFKGKTPEEIEALITASEAKETEEATKTGNLDKLLERWRTEKDTLETGYKAEIQRLSDELNKFKIDDKLKSAALEGGVIKEIVGDVVELVRRRTQLTEGDQLVILDEKGEPMSVSVEKFFTDVLKRDRPHYYDASGAGGSGATNGTKPARRGVDYSKLSANERLKLARQQTI